MINNIIILSYVFLIKNDDNCRIRTCAGYPKRFLVSRLNHSAKLSCSISVNPYLLFKLHAHFRLKHRVVLNIANICPSINPKSGQNGYFLSFQSMRCIRLNAKLVDIVINHCQVTFFNLFASISIFFYDLN